MPFAGWSPVGIAALVAIVAGIVLLVVYAVGRGLVHRELEGIDEPGITGDQVPAAPSVPARRSRTLGSLGAALLVLGLALGVISATGAWGSGVANGGPGIAPDDCAQAWGGCPKATPNQ
jgi:hypothetical protein